MPKVSLLKQLRSFLGITQDDVAEILGCTQSNVSKLEAGDVKLSILRKVAEAKGAKLIAQAEFSDATYTLSF